MSIAGINCIQSIGFGNNDILDVESFQSLLGRTFVFTFWSCAEDLSIIACQINVKCIIVYKTGWALVVGTLVMETLVIGALVVGALIIGASVLGASMASILVATALVAWSWWGISMAGCGCGRVPTRHR